MKSILCAALCAALAATAVANAQTPTDLAKSSVVAGFKQMGVPLDGKFQKFSFAIQFDPANPSLAQVRFDVDVGSFDIGDEAYNKEVRGKTWFHAAAFPKAAFVSSGVTPAGPGRYVVSGKLSIKGSTAAVAFPVTVRQEGAARVFDGVLPLKRLQFNIGDQEWKDTSLVADEVQLKFHVVSTAR
jgi:polyisoprenoid-binding protein YceI